MKKEMVRSVSKNILDLPWIYVRQVKEAKKVVVFKHLSRDANRRASIDSLASSVVLNHYVYGVFKSLADN